MAQPVNEAIFTLLKEGGYAETLHIFEQESGVHFDDQHFSSAIMAGKFDEALAYLSGFTTTDDNELSKEMFYRIRMQKLKESAFEHPKADRIELANDLLDLTKNNPRLIGKLRCPTFKTKELQGFMAYMWEEQQGQPSILTPLPCNPPNPANLPGAVASNTPCMPPRTPAKSVSDTEDTIDREYDMELSKFESWWDHPKRVRSKIDRKAIDTRKLYNKGSFPL